MRRPPLVVPADAIPVAVANSRLAAILGLTLLILFALQVVTVLAGVRSVLTWHVVFGLILLPPVGLKLTSVTWRMVSYPRGRDGFADITPPPPVLRVLGLFLAGLTVTLLVSGITLLDGCPGGRSHRPCSSIRSASTPGWPRSSCTSCRTSCRPCTWPAGTGLGGLAGRGARRAAGPRGADVAASLPPGAARRRCIRLPAARSPPMSSKSDPPPRPAQRDRRRGGPAGSRPSTASKPDRG